MKGSTFWQNISAAVVTGTLIAAAMNYPGALELWKDGGVAVLGYLAWMVGAKMLDRRSAELINRKYPNSQNGG